MLLLFNFEKKYFDEENIKNTFVGHPLIENDLKGKSSNR
jgi:lipid-A-disaccharide synthase